MKQTAVEWLFKQVKSKEWQDMFIWNKEETFKKAKEMEKEQIVDAWHNGYNNQSPMIDEENCGQQYYKETFKKD